MTPIQRWKKKFGPCGIEGCECHTHRFSRIILKLIEIYEIQNETLNKISRIDNKVSSEYAQSALAEVQKILEEKK
jgi:hypothetical protein